MVEPRLKMDNETHHTSAGSCSPRRRRRRQRRVSPAAAAAAFASVFVASTLAFAPPMIGFPSTLRRRHEEPILLVIHSSAGLAHAVVETTDIGTKKQGYSHGGGAAGGGGGTTSSSLQLSTRRSRRQGLTGPDADLLLQNSIRYRQGEVDRHLLKSSRENQRTKLAQSLVPTHELSPIHVPSVDRFLQNATDFTNSIGNNKIIGAIESESESPMRKRVKATMKVPSRVEMKNSLKPPKATVSRSSTMPGLVGSGGRTHKPTGRRYVDTPEQRSRRRKANGEALYKNSPTVPDSMVQFAGEIHNVDRISRTEEIELGEKTQEAIRLQNVYDVLTDKLLREPTNDEWCAASGKINMEAIRQAIDDGLEAKNKLVTSNLRMVQSVVNTYIRNGLTAQYNAGDMMQEGIMALIRAAEKFEPDRGWKFSTYATYWVRASVKRSQVFQSRIITVPQRLTENHKRLRRVENEMIAAAEDGQKPSRKELGAAVGMSELQVERCLTAMEQRCYSLDEAIRNPLKPGKGDDRMDTMLEIIESKGAEYESELIEKAMVREALVETLHRYLSPDEVQVLLLRYGVVRRPPSHFRDFALDRQVSIAELSHIFGIKPDKVRRMIDSSLKRLKGLGMEDLLVFERDLL